jgi:hypothetical protein
MPISQNRKLLAQSEILKEQLLPSKHAAGKQSKQNSQYPDNGTILPVTKPCKSRLENVLARHRVTFSQVRNLVSYGSFSGSRYTWDHPDLI